MRISSCVILCFSLSGTLAPGISHGDELEIPAPFVSLKNFSGFKTVDNTEIVIANMPRIRDQKQFDICFGMAPTTLAQKYICQVKGIKNCENVPQEMEISPLSTMAWSKKNTAICSVKDGKYFIDGSNAEVDPDECGDQVLPDTELTSYANVRFSGNGYQTLKNAATLFSFHSEACFSSDGFFKKFGQSAETSGAFIDEMKKFYFSNRNKEISCGACLLTQAIKSMNTTRMDEKIIRAALLKKNFQEFMFQIMFRDCERIQLSTTPTFKQIPDIPLEYIVTPRDKILISLGGQARDDVYYIRDDKKIKIEKISREDVLQKSREILSKGYPLMLDTICIRRNENGRCLTRHSTIIKGYKEACNDTECKKFLQLHNSWGEKWQDHFNGGWVEALPLLANVDTDEIRPGIISWYEN